MRRNRRSGFIYGLVALGLVTSLVSRTDQAQAQTTSNGPYYATPSWDQTLPAATRFVVLSNFNGEAVLDRETGLVWEKSPGAAPQTWASAGFACLNKNVGGRAGWRLPAIAELASLMDPSALPPSPTLPVGHPFTNVQLFYWSASTSAGNPTGAWIVLFGLGVVGVSDKGNANPVWCVRGGMQASVY